MFLDIRIIFCIISLNKIELLSGVDSMIPNLRIMLNNKKWSSVLSVINVLYAQSMKRLSCMGGNPSQFDRQMERK